MKYYLILNGPNLNLLGRRQPDVYGHDTLDDINRELAQMLPDGLSLDARQYNGEGGIIDALHVAGFDENCLGIVLNAGASVIAPVCSGSISGFGADSYKLALSALMMRNGKN